MYKTVFISLCLLCTYYVQGQPACNKAVLEDMIALNQKMKTDRLIISIRDTVVADVIFRGKPDDKYLVYSITKIFSGIAVGILIDKKLIESPEVPVSNFFEEWKNDSLKSKITIRHILQHTSGIAAGKGSGEIYPEHDFVRFALESDITSEPGQVFFYNNKAINIISGIVHKVSGQTLEQFIKDHVFTPLDINNYTWKHDQAGNTWGMDGLRITAGDLLKVGQMLCNYGEWNGKRLLSRNWCEMMFQIPLINTANDLYGYAMAIRSLPFQDLSITPQTVDTLSALGLPALLIQKLRLLHNKQYYKYPELGEKLKEIFTFHEIEAISAFASRHMIPLYTVQDDLFYIQHGGEYGLILTAFPKHKKVIVRYLGEKWGRKQKKDGSGYKYLIDNELANYMIRL